MISVGILGGSRSKQKKGELVFSKISLIVQLETRFRQPCSIHHNFKENHSEKILCSVISRNGPSTRSIPFRIVMLLLGVRCLRFRFNKQSF